MHKTVLASVLTMSLLAPATTAMAWWDEGHMQVAYVAYQRLDKSTLDKVDKLLRLNKDYDDWIAGAKDEETKKLYAFVHAATWADDIKEKPDYKDDKPTDPGVDKIIGYADFTRHKYWHFKDIYFSPDGSTTNQDIGPDAASQMKLMTTALPQSSGASDDIRSYSLVWMIHLAGDLHQPLHAAARVTREIPNGDQGGNLETVIPATGAVMTLHAYWDGIFGGYASPRGAVFDAGPAPAGNGKCRNPDQDGIACLQVSDQDLKNLDPDSWVIESRAIAEKYAYAPPVSPGTNAVMLTRDYETNARNIARARAALAGARLATILNAALK